MCAQSKLVKARGVYADVSLSSSLLWLFKGCLTWNSSSSGPRLAAVDLRLSAACRDIAEIAADAVSATRVLLRALRPEPACCEGGRGGDEEALHGGGGLSTRELASRGVKTDGSETCGEDDGTGEDFEPRAGDRPPLRLRRLAADPDVSSSRSLVVSRALRRSERVEGAAASATSP